MTQKKVAECQDDAEFLKMFLITEQEVVLEYSAVRKDHRFGPLCAL